MNILVISQYFYPESFRVNALAQELVLRGHSVTVLTGYPQYPYGKIYEGYGFDVPYEKEWNGVRIERVKMQPRGNNALGLLRNCMSFVRKGNQWVRNCSVKYDVVYVFEVSPVTVGLPAVNYKKKFGTPILFNVQDLWPENVIEVLGINNRLVIGMINRIVDKIYKNSDRILCASHGFVENIANRGVEREKLFFWPQFCETPDFNNMKKPVCYDENFFNVVFTGNIGYVQGLDLLLDVADKIRNMPIRWYIVGDGRAKDELEQQVQHKRLESSVFFMGKVSEHEANEYVTFADCAYLSFSDNKLFNMTIPAKLQTYLACGTPILAVAEGETQKIVEEAKCGVCATRTVDDVVRKLIDLQKLDAVSFEKIGKNGKYFFENSYNKKIIVDALERMFEEIN